MSMASEREQDQDGGSELAWLAFRYVAGEMAGDEAEAFERRLDQDQEAREAVAHAVELAGAVAAIPLPLGEGARRAAEGQRATKRYGLRHVPGEGQRATKRYGLRVFVAATAMAAAACLAWLAIDTRGPAPVRPGPRDKTPTAITPAATVALTWSTLDQERAADKGESSALLARNDDLPAVAESDDLSQSDPGLPRWLVDAAALAGRPEHAGPPANAKDL